MVFKPKLVKHAELYIQLGQFDQRLIKGNRFPFDGKKKGKKSRTMKSIMFTIFKSQDADRGISPKYKLYKKDIAFQTLVQAKRELLFKVNLPKGEYIIVPSTQYVGDTAAYALCVFSNVGDHYLKLKDIKNKSDKGSTISFIGKDQLCEQDMLVLLKRRIIEDY